MLLGARSDGTRPKPHHLIPGFHGCQLVEARDLIQRDAPLHSALISRQIRAAEQRQAMLCAAKRLQCRQPIRDELT